MSQRGKNKTSEIRCPGNQRKKELQDEGNDHLRQVWLTVKSNKDWEEVTGFINLKVTGIPDSNYFR